MTTVAEIIISEQIQDLKEICTGKRWSFEQLDEEGVLALSLPAKDFSIYGLFVKVEDIPRLPPAWHWCNPETKVLDQLKDIPKGSGYLHSSGRICAPWNRLAYKKYDPKGPHDDWEFSNWMSNPKTFGHTTLSIMALRIFIELNSNRYEGRMA